MVFTSHIWTNTVRLLLPCWVSMVRSFSPTLRARCVHRTLTIYELYGVFQVPASAGWKKGACFGMKGIGKPCTGKLFARFDEGGLALPALYSTLFLWTILNEFYQVTFRKRIYSSIEQLQSDLDDWLKKFNTERTHQGKMCCGRTPFETMVDGRKIWQQKNIA